MSETPVPVPFQDPGRVLHLLYESKRQNKAWVDNPLPRRESEIES